jgi:hypothetical protein
METMGIVDNGVLIDRTYRHAAPGQWVRELAINGIEAGATRIHFGVDWGHVDECVARGERPAYRLLYQDNGSGMEPTEELIHYFNNLSASSKAMGEHGNFGMGVRVTMLPWNGHGLAVMSWQDSDGGMIVLGGDKNGNYGVVKQRAVDIYGIEADINVVEPPRQYQPLEGGTGVNLVAMGRTGRENTFFGPPEDQRLRAYLWALQRRLFEIPESIEITCDELPSMDVDSWPDGDARRSDRGVSTRRRITTMASLLEKLTPVGHSGSVPLSDAEVYWWLLPPAERRPRSSASGVFAYMGLVATLYEDERIGVKEVYDLIDNASLLSQHAARFKMFGVPFTKVQQRLVLLVQARKAIRQAAIAGVEPDPSRRGLVYSDGPHVTELPWNRWGEEFKAAMPAVVVAALNEQYARLEAADPTERVKPYLDRMRQPVLRRSLNGKHRAALDDFNLEGGQTGTQEPTTVGAPPSGNQGNAGGTAGHDVTRIERPRAKIKTAAVNPRTNLPKVLWIYGTNDVSINPGAAATYDVVNHAVYVDGNYDVFSEVRDYYLSHYDTPGVEVTVKNAVETVYGAKFAARIFHAWAKKGSAGWSQDFFELVLSDGGMTGWVLGLEDADESIRRIVTGRHGALKKPTLAKSA